HSLAFTAEARNENLLFHMILNAYWEPLEFELSSANERSAIVWRRWLDTALDSPHDIEELQSAPLVPSRTYRCSPHSVVVLFAELRPSEGRTAEAVRTVLTGDRT